MHHALMYHRHPNLVHIDVGVGGYDRTSSIVHSLTHHVLTKQTLFLLKDLQRRITSIQKVKLHDTVNREIYVFKLFRGINF